MTIRAFTMPKWGIEMREGTITEWCAAEGDKIVKGQRIVSIETDKINNEIEAETPGFLKRILVAAGETVTVGALLAVFADETDEEQAIEALIASFGQPASGATRGTAGTTTATTIRTGTAISPRASQHAQAHGIDVRRLALGSGRGGRITYQDIEQALRPAKSASYGAPIDNAARTEAYDKYYASPLAKSLALQHKIELSSLKGTGPRGRISKTDVLARVTTRGDKSAGLAPDYDILPMSALRKTVARKLTAAKQTIPHFYLRRDMAIDRLLAARSCGRVKCSLNTWIVRAVALALVDVPDINIHVHDDAVHRYAEPAIALAVSTERGLVAPVVRGAQRLSLEGLGIALDALIEKSRTGRLTHADLEGATFTVSNLGSAGIDQFDAIISPPQGAILAIGAARRVWSEVGLGEGQFQSRLAVSLSCDHRAIDGMTGARFLQTLASCLDAPERLAAKTHA